MKTRKPSLSVGLLAGAAILACCSLNAQSYIDLNLDTGVVSSGTLNFGTPVKPFVSSTGTFGNDLTSFGVTEPLYSYAFSSETSPVDLASLVPANGLLYIYADAGHTDLLNVIGFLPDGPSYMVDMSLVSGTPGYLSGGLPTTTQLDSWFHITVPSEQVESLTLGANGSVTWTPPNNPYAGYLDDGAPITYTFTTVPDGGTTLCLLGGSVLVIGGLRRKFRA